MDTRALFIADQTGQMGFAFGDNSCPEWEHARPAAIVNIELPWLANLGFVLTVVGFLLQFFAFPGPKSIAEMREDLRIAKKQQQLNSK